MRPIGCLLIALAALGCKETVCGADRARCDRLCAGCADRSGCMRNGGECPSPPDAPPSSNLDKGDSGDDVFTPGCHYHYTDDGCSQGERFLDGDACAGRVKIIEWTLSRCHHACSELRDCDAECQKIGRGHGHCEPVPNACGAGRASAVCVCEQLPDGFNPT